jgi:hypothetical protein
MGAEKRNEWRKHDSSFAHKRIMQIARHKLPGGKRSRGRSYEDGESYA